jgi:predicted AAA+ superfamily ATPase
MDYIERQLDNELRKWQRSPSRKPLLLRGARQVGKSSAVRHLAQHFEYYVEVNFESDREVHRFFEGNVSPEGLVEKLSLYYDTPIVPEKTLLFFDEIQASLPAISSLRFFYEKMPALHLAAAGSLLEFALTDLRSFGVGRVRSLFVYPFSFADFLNACGQKTLREAVQQASPAKPLHPVIHEKILSCLRRFIVLGGMPEVVSKFVQTNDIRDCRQILDDLIISLQDDFSKYKKRVPSLRIQEIFDAVVRQMGGKFVYSDASQHSTHGQIKEALELLIMAGLVIPVTHTSANGIPLGAEINPARRKMLLVDTGIFQRLSGLNLSEAVLGNDFESINKGSLAELFVGLELLKSGSCYERHTLYYWHRETKSSNAEVDYVVQCNQKILPVEVKSGRQGSMQSLHLFLETKQVEYGIRTSLENFSEYDRIKVYPLYAIGNLKI